MSALRTGMGTSHKRGLDTAEPFQGCDYDIVNSRHDEALHVTAKKAYGGSKTNTEVSEPRPCWSRHTKTHRCLLGLAHAQAHLAGRKRSITSQLQVVRVPPESLVFWLRCCLTLSGSGSTVLRYRALGDRRAACF